MGEGVGDVGDCVVGEGVGDSIVWDGVGGAGDGAVGDGVGGADVVGGGIGDGAVGEGVGGVGQFLFPTPHSYRQHPNPTSLIPKMTDRTTKEPTWGNYTLD